MSGITRRQFTSLAAAAALGPRALADFLDDDLKNPNPTRVLQRPWALDPKMKLSLLGLGGVRLPVLSGNLGSQDDPVDYELGSKYLDYAIRHGINVFDSGYFYHRGDSERFYGHALSKHPRESFHFTTKAPPWNISSLADAKRIFQEQLDRCKMDYFDCYELHSLIKEEDYERTFVKTGAIDYYREEKAKGRIRHLGFSFHGQMPFLERLLSEGWAEVATILINGKDWKGANRSEDLYRKLEEKGLPVVVMEPLCGGSLAWLKPAAMRVLEEAVPGKSAASWSLRFAAHPKNVTTVLTGFTRLEHLQENIETFPEKGYRPFSEAEHKAYARAMELECGGMTGVPCSQCHYCMPCPYGVDIPSVFHFWNMRIKWNGLPEPGDKAGRLAFLRQYHAKFPVLRNASRCIGCGECAKKCPQWQFAIAKELARIDDYFRSIEHENPGYAPPLVEACL